MRTIQQAKMAWWQISEVKVQSFKRQHVFSQIAVVKANANISYFNASTFSTKHWIFSEVSLLSRGSGVFYQHKKHKYVLIQWKKMRNIHQN